MFIAIVISLIVGAGAASFAEFKLGRNFVDKGLDLFRSGEAKVANFQKRVEREQERLKKAVKAL